VTAGDPDLDTTVAAVKLLESHGADIIELGVPYSDPLADGAVLQARSKLLSDSSFIAQVAADTYSFGTRSNEKTVTRSFSFRFSSQIRICDCRLLQIGPST
jgi:hypothetical protein